MNCKQRREKDKINIMWQIILYYFNSLENYISMNETKRTCKTLQTFYVRHLQLLYQVKADYSMHVSEW